ncbi:MAG: hypothetical protein ABUR63_08680 [Verrucomicrobiota bacterium]
MTAVAHPTARLRRRRFPRLLGAGAFAAAVASSMTPGCRRSHSGTALPCAGGAAVAVASPDAPIGFDTPFVLSAIALCPEARAGHITWRLVSGTARDLAPQDDGFTLRARTPSLTDSVGGGVPWGIVPLSPRTRGEVVLEAVWRDDGGHEEQHQARVAAAPRSRGLPNTPVGVRIYLRGTGWHVDTRPRDSTAEPEIPGGRPEGYGSFLPDVAGDFRLVDDAGRALALRAARYDETLLDCGRSGCHQAITDAAARSPMTSVLARGLAPVPGVAGAYAPAFGPGYPDCAIACHATSEPGLPDGGFAHVARELAATNTAAVTTTVSIVDLISRRWADLPRPLRRLGGVGCLACHGPAALPETSARWSILRPGVCATCHDAPPRYGHVVAWGTTAMARADRDPRATTDRVCVRCHTTWGFLASLSDDKVDRRPPSDDDAPTNAGGISCAACHAAHDHARPASGAGTIPVAALLRTPVPPPMLGGAAGIPEKSRVCLACHAPDQSDAAPSASAAALWLGRGGIDPTTGTALNGPAPHARVAGGCVGCHRGGPADLARGAGHAFLAGAKICGSCHARDLPADDLRARAARLWAKYQDTRAAPAPGQAVRPPHADAAPDNRRPPDAHRAPRIPSTPTERALWNLALVIEDPAAQAHNLPYARALLAAAERALTNESPSAPRRQE